MGDTSGLLAYPRLFRLQQVLYCTCTFGLGSSSWTLMQTLPSISGCQMSAR
jgi:hypothetical protein